MKARMVLAVSSIALAVASCGTHPVREVVADGSYGARVPTSIQFAQSEAAEIPGGFAPLRQSGVTSIELVVSGDEVLVLLDGREAMVRQIEQRLVVSDSEGSGPFKAEKEVLVLGDDPLVVAGLIVDRPVIWPGSFEESPVITVKTRDPDDRGPAVSCRADELCVILSSGVDPVGRYEDANNPQLNENPIAVIDVSESSIEFTLDSDERVRANRAGEFVTDSCGLAETLVWDVPSEVGLNIEDPILVQAACPTTPGDVMLHIFDRSDMPILVSLDPRYGGEWCQPSRDCLMFVPAP